MHGGEDVSLMNPSGGREVAQMFSDRVMKPRDCGKKYGWHCPTKTMPAAVITPETASGLIPDFTSP